MSERKKGLVIAAAADGAVTVMTAQGEFIDLNWREAVLPEIGSEVEFAAPSLKLWPGILTQRRILTVAACFLILVLAAAVWSGLMMPASSQVMAYVSVDINPSIELGLNNKGRVVEAQGLNDDGAKLLEKLKLINIPSQKAIQMITAQAIAEGYLTKEKENAVLIAVDKLPEGNDGPKVSARVSEQVRNLDKQVEKVLKENELTAETDLLEVPAEIRRRAQELDVSAGKYVILMEAVEQGLDLTIEDIKGSGITKAIKDTGGIPGQVISQAKKNQDKVREVQERFEKKVKERKEAAQTLKPENPGNKPDKGGQEGAVEEKEREPEKNSKNIDDKNVGNNAGKNAGKNTDKNPPKNAEKNSKRQKNSGR